jgi:DNA-directed RNA polymerase subunit beta
VGTGFEAIVAQDSNNLINAEGNGEVVFVDSEKIQVLYERTANEKMINFDDEITTYSLPKFKRTNQGTCINLKPIVKKGEKVIKGQVLCEGFATQQGELALGQKGITLRMPL